MDQDYSCSSTDSLAETCLVGLPQGPGGSFRCPHLLGTVHDPDSGAVTEAASSQVQTASGASHALERYPWLSHTEGVLPTNSHIPYCSGGGCSSVGKGLLMGGNQMHLTQVQ